MTKKIIITFLLFFSTIINWRVFAECLIKDDTADFLSEYITNEQKIISNITSQIKSSSEEENTNIWDYMLWVFNNLISWEWYKSYFLYYVYFPLWHDITKEVKRDYSLLENEKDWLDKYLNFITKKWYNFQIENVCEWVSQDCNLYWTSVDIIAKLIKNHSSIMNIYRKSVMWDISSEDEYDLILVNNENNNFINDMINYYWLGNNCEDSEDSFFATIWKKWKK